MLAIIGGRPERFAPYVELYKRSLEEHGQPELPVGMHTLGFVAATDEEAVRIQWPKYQEQFARIGEERGWSPPTYEHFLAEVDHGSMYVGSPETVARRIAEVVRALDLSRFHLHYAIGRIPHEQRMAMIDLFGREVIPRTRELLAATPEPHRTLAAGGRS
jgi:alkanesulfonate monooxygenase SsuD/methylene tetrahydromethanopterin reductase-like flavin-dependent oxidoreductase (luciferase family)